MTDPYAELNSACRNRLIREYDEHNSIVVAFDFDDTVYDYHNKGFTYPRVIDALRRAKAVGCYLICWTGQQNVNLVGSYLIDNEIPFDVINDNPPFAKVNLLTPRKVYANIYLDDRAGLALALLHLLAVVEHAENKLRSSGLNG